MKTKKYFSPRHHGLLKPKITPKIRRKAQKRGSKPCLRKPNLCNLHEHCVVCGSVQLTGSKRKSWSTSGPATPIRFTPVPPSARISARTLASSARHAGVESRRCRGALSTRTSDCQAEKGNHAAALILLALQDSQATSGRTATHR